MVSCSVAPNRQGQFRGLGLFSFLAPFLSLCLFWRHGAPACFDHFAGRTVARKSKPEGKHRILSFKSAEVRFVASGFHLLKVGEGKVSTRDMSNRVGKYFPSRKVDNSSSFALNLRDSLYCAACGIPFPSECEFRCLGFPSAQSGSGQRPQFDKFVPRGVC